TAQSTNVTSCQISFTDNQMYLSLSKQFQASRQSGKTAVYFNFKVALSNGSVVPLSVSGPDTFVPYLWAWASTPGKNLLRLPLDYNILSLGVLGINTDYIGITVDESTADCFMNSSYNDTINVIAQYLSVNLTGNGTMSQINSDGPVVCRSAYAFSHSIF